MDGTTLFDKLLSLRGLNPTSLAAAIGQPTAQSGFDRFRKGLIKQPKRDGPLELAAKHLGVEVLAFYDEKLADTEWARVNGDSASAITDATNDEPAEGYIRLEHMEPQPSMGGGANVETAVRIVRHLDVLEQWVRQKVGSTNPERIKVMTGHGRSMSPTIHDQDLVFVDSWQHEIDLPGIYIVSVYNRLLLKRALILSDGTLILRSDNIEEYPDEERHDLKKAGDTIIIAGKVMAWWTLRQA